MADGVPDGGRGADDGVRGGGHALATGGVTQTVPGTYSEILLDSSGLMVRRRSRSRTSSRMRGRCL
ncbi:MAG: hypothetical protein U0694_16565 [Anaerolineae bacterium]